MSAVTRSVTKPTPFDFEAHPIRIVVIDGEPWFVAADVCEALGYTNSRQAVAAHLDDDEKGVTICDTIRGNQQLTIISESGMYTLVLRSHKPAARKFAKWVTRDVLPEIRKTGGFGEIEQKSEFDPKDLLFWAAREGDCTGLTFSPALLRAIELKAHSLSYEVREIIVAHLRGRVAYECSYGWPQRVINEEQAFKVVEKGGIGHALAYQHHQELGIVRNLAEVASRISEKLANQIANIDADMASQAIRQ